MTDTEPIFTRQQRPTMTQIVADNIREAIESCDEESAAFHIREHIIGSMNRLFKPETKDIS